MTGVSGALLRFGGTAVGVLLGFATGVWEVFLSPLYVGRVPLPVAPILAVATNLGLVWFSYFITGHKGLALLPGVAWFAVMIISASKTAEGDVPIPGSDWMGLLAVLLGALAWGIAAYRMILVTGTDRAVSGPPGESRPAPDKPATGKPGTGKPGTDKPGTDKPGTDKPVGTGRGPRPGARPSRPGTRPGGRRPGGNRGRGAGA
ncbi:MAG: hypothetical protein V7603_3915 [Micromonosporaceae bacterium]